MHEFAWIVPLLPLLAAAWIALAYLVGRNRGEAGERHTARAAVWSAALSLLVLLVLDGQAMLNGAPGAVRAMPWLESGRFTLWLGFMLDPLGLGIATLVAFIALLTLRFSVNYMHREAGFQRFFMILCLFTGAMLLLVMSGGALTGLLGWKLAGLSSYLLIAYAYDRETATCNATRAFVTNRIGDAGFILGISLSLFWIGSEEWSAILDQGTQLEGLNSDLIAASFLIAAMAKSAQVPFSPWITRALEGPTPSSAIFYGSLMVHAGVFLVLRLEPLFSAAPELMLLLALVGGVTALYGLFTGLVQTDVKSALIFSTLGQVGLMFLACGLGWFTLAAWHLAAHAAWRAYQFLSAPAMMHNMEQPTRPVPAFIQRRGRLYNACLQRFWLDELADFMLVKPTVSLARDSQVFDQQVVSRVIGLPGSASAISSLAQWEALKTGKGERVQGDTGGVGHGRGAAGRVMQWVASQLHWFEEHLVLRAGSKGVQSLIERLGGILTRVDVLLSHPRYLIMLIMITFVVIL